MAYSQSVQTFSYQVQNYGGNKRYLYNGKTFNTEAEVMNEIRNSNPGYKIIGPGNTYQGNSYQGNSYQGNNYLKNNYLNNNYLNNNYLNNNYQGNSLQNTYQQKPPQNSYNQPGNSISNHIGTPFPTKGYYPSNPSSNVIPPYNQKPYNPPPYKPSQNNKPVESNTMYPWLDPKKFIDNNQFSAKIWRHVWEGCHYPCFSKNNYQELKLRMLKETNQYRYAHGAKPLTMDQSLSNLAQVYAQKLASMKRLEHDYADRRYGENLGMSTSYTAYIIVKQWYDEEVKWNYNSAKPIHGTGHFTQLVWTNTQRVGFGVVEAGGITYVVARYDPKGNIIPFLNKYVLPRNRHPNGIY
ncbi:CAP domain-containing protein [Strongyloides ratti]|nr:CAP domain-containing protein [Strongyloides ratti]CEF66131.1 CAP domain-containing protein [Strongyloides ratti]